ncbi:MAG TPA: amidohydrolase family protein [Terriglobia bacterium]|nr:amidohydrolase family protein [Terriglobia bacterium]
MDRRTFLSFAAGFAAVGLGADGGSMPIIDTHIHLFDPTRPQGVPWPDKDDAVLYKPASPARYRKVTQGLGIVGAIEIECSPWLEDNQWVLDIAAKDTIIVGTVGDLEPGKPDFGKHLERFHKNPLFRGIRCGNLWGRNLAAEVTSGEFVSNIKALADAGLGLDTANQDSALLEAVIRLTDKVPNLRVVIDHLPQANPPEDPGAREEREADLRELAARPNVYVKLSEVLRRVDGQVHYDLGFYRSRLDHLWETFGEDRVLFGSDWPNSDRWGSYQQVLNLVHEYVAGKGKAAMEKYFWKNSVQAYQWVKRAANQPQPNAK